MYQHWWCSPGVVGQEPERTDRRRRGVSRITRGQIVTRQQAIMIAAPSTTVRMPNLMENPVCK